MNLTKDEIIKLAKECGIKRRHNDEKEVWCYEDELLAFSNACEKIGMEKAAKICDAAKDDGDAKGIERDVFGWNKATSYCAKAIRANKE